MKSWTSYHFINQYLCIYLWNHIFKASILLGFGKILSRMKWVDVTMFVFVVLLGKNFRLDLTHTITCVCQQYLQTWQAFPEENREYPPLLCAHCVSGPSLALWTLSTARQCWQVPAACGVVLFLFFAKYFPFSLRTREEVMRWGFVFSI